MSVTEESEAGALGLGRGMMNEVSAEDSTGRVKLGIEVYMTDDPELLGGKDVGTDSESVSVARIDELGVPTGLSIDWVGPVGEDGLVAGVS